MRVEADIWKNILDKQQHAGVQPRWIRVIQRGDGVGILGKNCPITDIERLETDSIMRGRVNGGKELVFSVYVGLNHHLHRPQKRLSILEGEEALRPPLVRS